MKTMSPGEMDGMAMNQINTRPDVPALAAAFNRYLATAEGQRDYIGGWYDSVAVILRHFVVDRETAARIRDEAKLQARRAACKVIGEADRMQARPVSAEKPGERQGWRCGWCAAPFATGLEMARHEGNCSFKPFVRMPTVKED